MNKKGETQASILTAATTLFSRYGVKRTSMASVAELAGLSRQTLYSIYPSKDELLAAAMGAVIDQILYDLTKAWHSSSTVEETLGAYFEHAVLKPFDMLQQTPDLKDLLHGVGNHTKKLVSDSEHRKSLLLAAQLERIKPELRTAECNPEAIAQFIVKTSTQFKFTASNRQELEQLIDTLGQAVTSLTA